MSERQVDGMEKEKRVIEVARINHICFDCLGGIRRGEKFERTTRNGRTTHKLCMDCLIGYGRGTEAV